MENKPLKSIEALSKALDIISSQRHDDNLEGYLHTVEDAIDERDQMLKEFNANNYEEWQEIVDKANQNYGELATLLFIIIMYEVNIHSFREYIVLKNWTYEQYVEEETDPNTSGHQFAELILSEADFEYLKKCIKQLTIGE